MAVIAPSRFAALFLALTCTLTAQQSKAIREQMAHVGTALSSGNPEEAMTPFDKSFDNYGKLADYFTALTNAYTLTNDVEITSEEISNQDATLTVHWIMTLSDLKSGLSEVRAQDLTLKLSLKKYDWRIVSIAPLEFFNPEIKSK
jgi:hypothetical protein